MLSIDSCRQLLAPECTLSDAGIQAVRDQLYQLAAVVVDAGRERAQHLKQKGRSGGGAACKGVRVVSCFERALEHIPEAERLQVEERAAILEFEGGLDRDTAERKAVSDWLAERR